jgi:predicted transposase YbfD/YdcC
LEIRKCEIFDNLEGIDTGWIGLKSLVKITREITSRKTESCKETKETAYFISSLNPNQVSAKEFNEGIRNHWSVEVFHYTKDVTFKEDSCKCNSNHSAQNLSVMRNIVINLFRQNGYTNFAQAIRLVANSIPILWRMLSA